MQPLSARLVSRTSSDALRLFHLKNKMMKQLLKPSLYNRIKAHQIVQWCMIVRQDLRVLSIQNAVDEIRIKRLKPCHLGGGRINS